MTFRLVIVAFFAPGAILFALSACAPCRACAPVSGTGTHVAVATESALIVWDEKAKTQHFIRRASFETKVPYFGFLVPTPTQPELAEAPDELFTRLEDWTKPEVRREKIYKKFAPFSMSAELSEGLAPNKGVT